MDLINKVPVPVLLRAFGAVFRLPAPVRRLLAGKPVRIDGQRLDLDLQLLLRLQRLNGDLGLSGADVTAVRAQMSLGNTLVAGPALPGVHTRDLRIGHIGARLYTPDGLPDGSPLLVFYHGGGFVICDLDTHDNACRFLATRAGVRVLSVDYRLAPEHPFPAAVDDALAAYRWAREHAAELGADPAALAVGGDSAGGNLSLVVAMTADPDFVLAFYPVTNPARPTASRDRFGTGFFLTAEDITFFADAYSTPDQRTDPRYAPAQVADLSAMPPTCIVTAGFDPLRDEGEAFAARLAEAGVPVVLRRHPELIHGFINMTGVSAAATEAFAEAAGALRTGLALGKR